MAFPILGRPRPQFHDSSGEPLQNGTLAVLDPADDTNKASYPTYDDAEATTNANANPITLNARGEPETALWGLDSEDYKLVLKDSAGATVTTDDDVYLPGVTQAGVGKILYPQTPAESSAGVTPTNYEYEPGNVLRYGTNATPGTTDMEPAITAAISVASENGGVVFIPAGIYFIGSKITVPGGVILQGEGGHTGATTANSLGTMLVSGVAANVDTIQLGISQGVSANNQERRSPAIRDIKVIGDATDQDGIYVADGVHEVEINNVHCDKFRYGFEFDECWIIRGTGLTSRECTECFRFSGGTLTSSVFSSCVAYNSDYGWRFTDDATYSSFICCNSDGCATGISVEGDVRTFVFTSPGIEGATTAGIVVNSTNACVEIIAPNFGDHSSDAISLINVNAALLVTITSWRMPSAFEPAAGGEQLTVAAGTDVVTLLNPRLNGSRIGDVDQCTVIGGVIGSGSTAFNRMQRGLIAPELTTDSGVTASITSSGGQSAAIFTPAASSTYLVFGRDSTSGVERFEQTVTTNGSGTIIISTGETANLQLVDSSGDIVIQNDSGSAQVVDWSYIKVR